MKSTTYRYAEKLGDFISVQRLLSKLETEYPDFNSWYWNKIIPKVSNSNTGTKIIITEKYGDLVGASIIKKDGNERKLCALRVIEKYQSRGIGLHLIDRSLKELDCSKPLCSVSQSMINEYSRIFINKYDFNLTYVYKGIYNRGMLEYEFNGIGKLQEKSSY